jgi:tripartite-type tricarboxylate transporter receptor subunit TctC
MNDRTTKEDEIIAELVRIAEEVENDPEVAKKAEEFQRKYGTLTEEDLRITFTI